MSKLKITLLTEHFPQETFIRWQAQELDCSIVAGSLEQQVPVEFKKDRLFGLGGSNGFKASRPKRLLHRLQEKWLHFPSPRFSQAMEIAWNSYLEQKRPDVVLACFGTNGHRALAGCKRHNIPIVVQFLGADASLHLKNKAYLRGLKSLSEYASQIIVLSNSMKHRLVLNGALPNKVTVLPIGVPVHDLKPKPSNSDNSDIFKFLAIGRFVAKKAPSQTILAFAKCHANNPKTRLTLVGDGPLLNSCRKLICQKNLSHCIETPGRLKYEDVEKLYAQSHCFVQHSVTAASGDCEGWPLAIADASARGLPVVATRHEGICDQIIEGKTGLLSEEFDFDKMSKHMLALSLDLQKSERMGVAGRRFIMENADIKHQAHKLREILLKAVSQK